jgi:uncharacterized RDD family membrane protein YckC
MTFQEPLLVDDVGPELAPARYAGMWRRFGATLVDFALVANLGRLVASVGLIEWDLSVRLIFYYLYFQLSYVCPWHATPGQRLFGVHVANKDGSPLSQWRAALRTIAILSCFFGSDYMLHDSPHRGMIHFIYFTVAALLAYTPAWFTREKTALHDILSGSRVRIGRI